MATDTTTRRAGLDLRAGRTATSWQLLRGYALRRPAASIFILAFAARAAVAFAVWVRRDGLLFNDDGIYHFLAAAEATHKTAAWGTTDHFLYHSVLSLLLPLTLLYRVFGVHPLIGQLFVAAFGAATAVFVYAFTAHVISRTAALVAGVIVALLPSQVIFSSVMLKDPLSWAGLALLCLVALHARKASTVRALAGVAVAELALVLILGHVRDHTSLVASAVLLATVVVEPARRKLVLVPIALVVLLVGPWMVGLGPAGIHVMENRQLGRVRSLNAYGADTGFVTPPTTVVLVPPVAPGPGAPVGQGGSSGSGGSGGSAGSGGSGAPSSNTVPAVPKIEITAVTPDGVGVGADIRHLPRGMSVILTEPYPWQWSRNRRTTAAGLETIVWYPVLALAAVGAVEVVRKRRMVFPLLALLATALVYALTDGNFGTAYRHRGELIWAAAVLAGIGVDVFHRRRLARTEASA